MKYNYSLNRFARDLNRIEPLTCEQKQGFYETIFRYKDKNDLNDEENREYKNAVNRIVSDNIKFVIYIAFKVHQFNPGVSLEDLISEGNLGLIRAAERFDYTMGWKFLSYAVSLIKRGMYDYAFENSKAVKYPMSWMILLKKIKRAQESLLKDEKDPMNLKMISKLSGISGDIINKVLEMNKKKISLDKPVRNVDGEEKTYLDFIEGENPEEDIIDSIDRSQNSHLEVISNLLEDDREGFEILTLHHIPNNGGRSLTLEEIGRIYGLTRERIRQIEARAKKKLNHPERKKFLLENL